MDNFKPYTGKTENGNPDLVKTTQIVRVVLCSQKTLRIHLVVAMSILTGTTPHQLGMNMMTTGTVMPSRKEMPEPLKKRTKLEADIQTE
jgi:hypothetical protein